MTEGTTHLRGGNGGNGEDDYSLRLKNFQGSIYNYYETVKKSEQIASKNFKNLNEKLERLQESNTELYPMIRNYLEIQSRPCWIVRIINSLAEYMREFCGD